MHISEATFYVWKKKCLPDRLPSIGERSAERGRIEGIRLDAHALINHLHADLYGHLGSTEMRRLQQLEEANGGLKQLVAELTLDKHILREAIRKNR
jgi:hypothetical protein